MLTQNITHCVSIDRWTQRAISTKSIALVAASIPFSMYQNFSDTHSHSLTELSHTSTYRAMGSAHRQFCKHPHSCRGFGSVWLYWWEMARNVRALTWVCMCVDVCVPDCVCVCVCTSQNDVLRLTGSQQPCFSYTVRNARFSLIHFSCHFLVSF